MKLVFFISLIFILHPSYFSCSNSEKSIPCNDSVYQAIIDSAERYHAQGSVVWQKLLDSAISKCPTKPYAWHARSVWHTKTGDYKTGFIYLDQAVRLDSFQIGYRGWIKLYKLHDFCGAILDLEAYNKKYGNIPAVDEHVSYLLGLAYKQIDSTDLAIEHFNSYITNELRDKPGNYIWPYVYVYRGLCLEKKKDTASSINDFSKAIDLYSNCAEAYFHRGRLFLESESAETALLDLKKSLLLYDSGYYYKNEYKEYFDQINREDIQNKIKICKERLQNK
jgi:tetratricopeptide (TPR) repeat protein